MKNKEESKVKQNKNISNTQKAALIVLSFLGAFMLWIYAIGYDSTLFERTFDGVEVVIEGESALAENKGYTLAREQEFSSITVVAKGKRSELNALNSSDFRAVIDVSQSQSAGTQTLNIVVYSPNGIEVVSQSSTTATVYVDEFTQRDEMLSVSVDTGDGYVMSEGISFVNSVANPLSVIVSGPASVLDSVEGAYVKFNLDGYEISDNIYGYGVIELRDKSGKVIDNPYVTVSESTAYVTVTVTKQKTLPVRVMFNGGMFDADDVTLEVSAESIMVSGSPNVLSGIDELVLSIDETAIDGNKEFEFNVGSMLPSGITNDSGISKIDVRVTMPKLAVRTYNIKSEKINVLNLPEGEQCKINNDLQIKIIGAREAIDEIDFEAITATVDFDRVTVEAGGSYSANASISLGGEYALVYILNEDHTVKFEITENE
ncbi:MAG: hypothetical protein J6Q89_00555 [Clostridia bacterium]|nr:hypothetical protein [Clostridia bacterium]